MTGLIHGKQIQDSSIPGQKLDPTYEATLLKQDGSRALTSDLDAGAHRILNLADPSTDSDAVSKRYVDAVFNNQNQKAAVVAATVSPIALIGKQVIDNVVVQVGDRVLVKDQAAPETNGIYTVATGAWTRTLDADSASDLTGAMVMVLKGNVNANHLFKQDADDIVFGTTPIVWTFILATSVQAYATSSNKMMVANTTNVANDRACQQAISFTPAGDGYVLVTVNGVEYSVGDGVRSADFFFSGDNSVTVRKISDISAGDTLHVGTTLGFTLDGKDLISLFYET